MTTLYVIECATPYHFYVGISKEIDVRIKRHVSGHGSSWTRLHGFKKVVLTKEFPDDRLAKQAEMMEVKRLRRIGNVRGAGWTSIQQGGKR